MQREISAPPLANLAVVLVKTRFPENIGMAARAMANMGCPSLRLVAPERRDGQREASLATPKGIPVLDNMRTFPSLDLALRDSHLVFASSARQGGWRKNRFSPEEAAARTAAALVNGEKVSLVFGPEDKGLENSEILQCGNVIHIPTYGASSLNLAQAVLILLHECAKKAAGAANIAKQPKRINHEDLARLENELRDVLTRLDCLQGKDSAYYFIQWQTMLNKASLRRHEYDALMGFLRQIKNKLNF